MAVLVNATSGCAWMRPSTPAREAAQQPTFGGGMGWDARYRYSSSDGGLRDRHGASHETVSWQLPSGRLIGYYQRVLRGTCHSHGDTCSSRPYLHGDQSHPIMGQPSQLVEKLRARHFQHPQGARYYLTPC